MTLDEIIQAINDAPPDRKIDTAEKLLAEYDGEDKPLVEPWLLEMAIVLHRFEDDLIVTQ